MMICYFFRALGNLLVVAWDSDWFISLLAPVLIGRSKYLAISFSTVI